MDATEGAARAWRVGQFLFTIEAGEEDAEFKARWNRRAEALAAWLMDEWRREHAEAAHVSA